MTRVIAGRWRGRVLFVPAGRELRPTTDRVKEALFSTLGERVSGAVVVDLCCGTGGLGIEALSRGAASACFVDLAPSALAATRVNLARCGASPASYRLYRQDALRWLAGCGDAVGTGPVIVLADPPYTTDLGARLLAALTRRVETLPLIAAAVEHRERLTVPSPTAAGGAAWRQRRYGDTFLTILEA